MSPQTPFTVVPPVAARDSVLDRRALELPDVTEIPEHLLSRSRERRSALGLGGGEEGGSAPAAAGPHQLRQPQFLPCPGQRRPPCHQRRAAPPPPKPVPVMCGQRTNVAAMPIWAVPVLALPSVVGLHVPAGDNRESAEGDGPDGGRRIMYSKCAQLPRWRGRRRNGYPLMPAACSRRSRRSRISSVMSQSAPTQRRVSRTVTRLAAGSLAREA